jgi:hypothetical protein
MLPRSRILVGLAVAGASLAGTALATGGWRLGLGAFAIAAAGVFGGLLDGQGRAPQRTMLLLGLLTYLVVVPVLGFSTRGLAELGSTRPREWVLLMIAALGLLATFFAAREWRLHQRGPGSSSGPVVTSRRPAFTR